MFPTSSERDDTSLQDLINDWHDAEGHSRTLLGCSPGTCIHLDRLNGTNPAGKLFPHFHVLSHIAFPCHVDGSVKWCAFTIAAMTYHGRITIGRTLAYDCGAGGPMVSLDELWWWQAAGSMQWVVRWNPTELDICVTRFKPSIWLMMTYSHRADFSKLNLHCWVTFSQVILHLWILATCCLLCFVVFMSISQHGHFVAGVDAPSKVHLAENFCKTILRETFFGVKRRCTNRDVYEMFQDYHMTSQIIGICMVAQRPMQTQKGCGVKKGSTWRRIFDLLEGPVGTWLKTVLNGSNRKIFKLARLGWVHAVWQAGMLNFLRKVK